MNSSDKPAPPPNIPKWLLPLTSEEQSLLEMYDKVKALEREAKIGASMAARLKLMGERGDPTSSKLSNEDMNTSDELERDSLSKQPVMNPSEVFEKPTVHDGKEYSNDNHVNHTDKAKVRKVEEPGDVDTIQQQDEIRRRQNAKLESLRLEHEAAIKKKEQDEAAAKAEEEMRQKLLMTVDHDVIMDTVQIGPTLKKKQQRNWDEIESAEVSLVESMVAEAAAKEAESFETSLKRKKRRTDEELEETGENTTTSLHDLSATLDRNDEIQALGSFIFPNTELSSNLTWTPPPTASNPQDGCLLLPLLNADSNADPDRATMNTIAIKFLAPSDSKRFSLNITTPQHDNYNKVLFHFNPRQFQKGGMLVLNHKADGIWGQAINIPLALLPIMFGEPITLIIQITNRGFDVFIQEQHCARMEHRTPLKVGPLLLQFPSTDDYGTLEHVTVYKVWFGHRESMASGDLSNVFGVDLTLEHPKKLFVRGLTRIVTDSEADVRRAELERAFKKYGGALGVKVTVSKNTTFAFVEVETERLANLAISEMSSQFTMSKARRSREESVLDNAARPSADSWD